MEHYTAKSAGPSPDIKGGWEETLGGKVEPQERWRQTNASIFQFGEWKAFISTVDEIVTLPFGGRSLLQTQTSFFRFWPRYGISKHKASGRNMSAIYVDICINRDLRVKGKRDGSVLTEGVCRCRYITLSSNASNPKPMTRHWRRRSPDIRNRLSCWRLSTDNIDLRHALRNRRWWWRQRNNQQQKIKMKLFHP